MKNLIALLLLAAVALACSDLDSTSYQTDFMNDSGHSLQIKPYTGGVALSDNIISLAASEQKTVDASTCRGLGNGENYGSFAFDSIVVVFDGTDSIVHNCLGIPGNNPKSYQYSNSRNLRNSHNYLLQAHNPKKHHREVRYLYTFTYQDYLDAQ